MITKYFVFIFFIVSTMSKAKNKQQANTQQANTNKAQANTQTAPKPNETKPQTAQKNEEKVKTPKKVWLKNVSKGSYNGIKSGQLVEVEADKVDYYKMQGFTDSLDKVEVEIAEENKVDPREEVTEKLKSLNIEFSDDEDLDSLLAKYQEATKTNDVTLTDDDKEDLLD